jgi:hypothetical protein
VQASVIMSTPKMAMMTSEEIRTEEALQLLTTFPQTFPLMLMSNQIPLPQ